MQKHQAKVQEENSASFGAVQTGISLNFNFFLLVMNYFFVFLDCFDMLMSKIILKNKKIIFIHF
jgi:hypothetical protein